MINSFLLEYPDKRLKCKGIDIPQFNENLHKIAAVLRHHLPLRAGFMTATQLGLSLNLIVMDSNFYFNQPQILVNPKIVEKEGRFTHEWECDSFPGLALTMERSQKIQVEYLNEVGSPQNVIMEGIVAGYMQQALDHLQGIFIVDYLSNLKKERLLKKYLKERKRGHCHDSTCTHDHGH